MDYIPQSAYVSFDYDYPDQQLTFSYDNNEFTLLYSNIPHYISGSNRNELSTDNIVLTSTQGNDYTFRFYFSYSFTDYRYTTEYINEFVSQMSKPAFGTDPYYLSEIAYLNFSYAYAMDGVKSALVESLTPDTFTFFSLPYFYTSYKYNVSGSSFNLIYTLNLLPKQLLPADYPIGSTPIPDPPVIADGVLPWLYSIGELLLSANNVLNDILSFSVGGVNIFYILFGSGFIIYVGWTIVKWFIPI